MMKNRLKVIKRVNRNISFEVTNADHYKKTKQVVFFVTHSTIFIISFKFINTTLPPSALKILEKKFSTEFGEGKLVFYSGNNEPAPKINIKFNKI